MGECILGHGLAGEAAGAQPGDLLLTARNSPGSEWIACDGSTQDEAMYPDLVGVVPTAGIGGDWALRNIDATVRANITCFLVAGGYWIAVASGSIFYTADPMGTWTKKQLNSVSQIRYLNGYFVAFGPGATLYYATSLGGTWASVNVYPYGHDNTLDVAYGNGRWLAVCDYTSTEEGSYNTYLYQSNALESGWQSATYPTGSFGSFKSCSYINGNFLVVRDQSIAFAASPAGPWTSPAAFGTELKRVIYANGYYWIAGRNLYYATGLGGPWAVVPGIGTPCLSSIKTYGGKVVAGGRKSYYENVPVVLCGTNPNDWALMELQGVTGDMYDIEIDAKYIAASLNNTLYQTQFYTTPHSRLKMPKIEIPGVKAYMRGKK